MNIKGLANKIKPPCGKCLYKLGLVHTAVNPCPQCKESGYQTFERLQKQAIGDGSISGDEHK